jgi:hypothetical protein
MEMLPHFTRATKPAQVSLWWLISIVPGTYSSDAIGNSPKDLPEGSNLKSAQGAKWGALRDWSSFSMAAAKGPVHQEGLEKYPYGV